MKKSIIVLSLALVMPLALTLAQPASKTNSGRPFQPGGLFYATNAPGGSNALPARPGFTNRPAVRTNYPGYTNRAWAYTNRYRANTNFAPGNTNRFPANTNYFRSLTNRAAAATNRPPTR